jgi:hypothetical protein
MNGTSANKVCGIAAVFSSMTVLGFVALIGVVMVV